MIININLVASIELHMAGPVSFQVEAADIFGMQTVLSSYISIQPYVELQPYLDIYGNRCRRGFLAKGEYVLAYNAVVELSDVVIPERWSAVADTMQLPPDAMLFLLPSRYCESDRLEQFSRSEFAGGLSGFEQVDAIRRWINSHVAYRYGTTTVTTSACETVIERTGVCRDFAHLGIALCRAVNIPARYAAGYCLGLDPPDFHAYFQAYLDGQWRTFDATNIQPRPALVVISVGRDAADCAWSSFFSDGYTKNLEVAVTVAN